MARAFAARFLSGIPRFSGVLRRFASGGASAKANRAMRLSQKCNNFAPQDALAGGAGKAYNPGGTSRAPKPRKSICAGGEFMFIADAPLRRALSHGDGEQPPLDDAGNAQTGRCGRTGAGDVRRRGRGSRLPPRAPPVRGAGRLWRAGSNGRHAQDAAHGAPRVVTVEGGELFEGDLDKLRALDADVRVRMIALTWNFENELGFPAMGGLEKRPQARGREFLAEMGRLRVLADVSHLNEGRFLGRVRVFPSCRPLPAIRTAAGCATCHAI